MKAFLVIETKDDLEIFKIHQNGLSINDIVPDCNLSRVFKVDKDTIDGFQTIYRHITKENPL